MIPVLRLNAQTSSECLPEGLRTNTVASIGQAEAVLASAAQAYDQAISAAGEAAQFRLDPWQC